MSIVGLRYYPVDNSCCRDLDEGKAAMIRPCPLVAHPLEEYNDFVIESEPYLTNHACKMGPLYKAIQIRSLQTGKRYEVYFRADCVQKMPTQRLDISIDSKVELNSFQLKELSLLITNDIKDFLERLDSKTTIHVSIKL